MPVGEIFDIVGGGTPSKKVAAYYGGDIPWATIRDMNSFELKETEHTITKAGLKNSSSKLIRAGEVIMASRVGLGKACILKQDTAINQDIRALIPRVPTSIDRRFCLYWLQSIEKTILDAGSGATVQGIKLPFIKSLPFPNLGLEEQKRIVAVLDRAFAALDHARANAEANLADAQKLFLNVTSSRLEALGKGGKFVSVGSIAEHSLGKMLDKHKNKGALSRYLRNLNVRWFEVDTSDVLEMRIEERERERYIVRRGDLLICEGGYPGRASIYESDERIYFQKALHRVRFADTALAKILMYWLYVEDQAGRLKEHFTGTGISHFTGQVLDAYPMPVSSGARNADCVRGIENCRQQTGVVQLRYRQQISDLAALRQSLLQKAFAGQLA